MIMDSKTLNRESIYALLAEWPNKPQEVAKQTIEKYGLPDEATPSRLIWFDNGPWKRTVVFREEVQHDFPKPHSDILEQAINYQVPPEKFDELAKFDGSVMVERTKGEMSARCDREEANILALNLAHEIATGKRSVDDARSTYAESIKALMQKQPPSIMQELKFKVPTGKTGDPDKTVIRQSG